MEQEMKQVLAEALEKFHPPRYIDLPNMGLYLEQTTKYINQCLAPLGIEPVTGSMVRNYVKQGFVAHPVKKQYYADQIAHLLCIAVLKSVLTLEQIGKMFCWQQQVYSDETAYDYFFLELQNMLDYRAGRKSQLDAVGTSSSPEKVMLHSAVAAVSHIIFLNVCFAWQQKQEM